jgi:hypothetical protein
MLTPSSGQKIHRDPQNKNMGFVSKEDKISLLNFQRQTHAILLEAAVALRTGDK